MPGMRGKASHKYLTQQKSRKMANLERGRCLGLEEIRNQDTVEGLHSHQDGDKAVLLRIPKRVLSQV